VRFFFGFLIILPGLALASEGFAGTKAGPAVQGASSGGGIGVASMLQMLLALAIVACLLKFVLPRLAGRLKSRIVPGLGTELRVEETAAFAGGSLYIVQARRKTLLLSASASGVSCLADLTEDPQLPPEPPTFQELVETAQAVIEPNEEAAAEPTTREIEAALERLKRLSA
jgi:hypothetical protein